jgi:tRNA dimethylallyltransferase
MQGAKTIIYIAGPTASGKSAQAVELANNLHSAVLSADSRQFYRNMPIATAQISEFEQKGIPHFFLSFLNPDEAYSAGQFEKDALQCTEDWFKTNDTLILTGGSGLYARALLYGFSEMPAADPEIRQKVKNDYDQKGLAFLQNELKQKDPDAYEQIDEQNPRRIIRAIELIRTNGKTLQELQQVAPKPRLFKIVTIGLDWPREALYARIDQRVGEMVEAGLIEEAKALKAQGYASDLPALRAVGFPEMFAFLNGEIDKAEAIRRIQQHTRNYAKRQLTWLRKEPNIVWFQPENFANISAFVQNKLQS